MKTEQNTPIMNVINSIINDSLHIKEIVKNSGYNPYLLSCKLRVVLSNSKEVEDDSINFGISKYEYVSYFCDKVENIRN